MSVILKSCLSSLLSVALTDCFCCGLTVEAVNVNEAISFGCNELLAHLHVQEGKKSITVIANTILS